MNGTGYSVTFLTFNTFSTTVRLLYSNTLHHLEKNQCLTLRVSFHCHLPIHHPYRHQLLTKCLVDLLAKNCQKTTESVALQMVKLPSHFPLGQADKKVNLWVPPHQFLEVCSWYTAVGELGRMVAFVADQCHQT